MTIRLNDHITTIPSGWNDLNKKQLLAITSLINKPIEYMEFKAKVLFAFTGWKLSQSAPEYYIIKTKKHDFTVALWQIVEILDAMDWFFKSTETKAGKLLHINATITRCTITHFSVNLRKYYGPADRLYNITFGEYLAADNYFSRYMETKEPGFLNKLVATLYRPKDKKYTKTGYDARGDIREPFNDNNIEARAKKISKIPEHVKQAILMFFNGCKIALSETFTEVFSEKSGGKNKFGGLSLVAALSGGDVTKSKIVREQYLYDVMVSLDETTRSHREIIKKAKK